MLIPDHQDKYKDFDPVGLVDAISLIDICDGVGFDHSKTKIYRAFANEKICLDSGPSAADCNYNPRCNIRNDHIVPQDILQEDLPR
jgi:hypothetical protein